VFQKAGPGGPAMWVWIGDGQRPVSPPDAFVVVLPVRRRGRHLIGGRRG
jgi:hypothetical protein